MSKSLDEALNKVLDNVAGVKGLLNDAVINKVKTQIKRAYLQHADYTDIELIIRDRGEAELMEIQGALDEALEKYREENP